MFLWVVWAEYFLVVVLAGEVEGSSWEVTDDVGEATSPEGASTLLGDDSAEAMSISDTIKSVFDGDVLVCILDLQQELDSLDWSNEGLGNGGEHTSNHEVSKEACLLLWPASTPQAS